MHFCAWGCGVVPDLHMHGLRVHARSILGGEEPDPDYNHRSSPHRSERAHATRFKMTGAEGADREAMGSGDDSPPSLAALFLIKFDLKVGYVTVSCRQVRQAL